MSHNLDVTGQRCIVRVRDTARAFKREAGTHPHPGYSGSLQVLADCLPNRLDPSSGKRAIRDRPPVLSPICQVGAVCRS